MSQKIQTVPITSTSGAFKVRINNGKLQYLAGDEPNTAWVDYEFDIQNHPNLQSDKIADLVNSLQLDEVKPTGLDTLSAFINAQLTQCYLNKISLFNQLMRTDLINDKTALDTTKFPEPPILELNKFNPELEYLDFNYLIEAFTKILKDANHGMMNNTLTTISSLVIGSSCKAVKVRVLYQLKSELNEAKTWYRVRSLVFSPTRRYTKIDRYFSIEFKNNRLRVLKSFEVAQIFIRTINFVI